ncbi:MAG: hypothetical protein [Bacteriophage sp.]|nr:MAG: hypothetical protein [Bacteriophage sp.]
MDLAENACGAFSPDGEVLFAEVMEQADKADSKSVAARRVGSNPTFSTIIQDWRISP